MYEKNAFIFKFNFAVEISPQRKVIYEWEILDLDTACLGCSEIKKSRRNLT